MCGKLFITLLAISDTKLHSIEEFLYDGVERGKSNNKL